jgi:positive regulator of sigma E activity
MQIANRNPTPGARESSSCRSRHSRSICGQEQTNKQTNKQQTIDILGNFATETQEEKQTTNKQGE